MANICLTFGTRSAATGLFNALGTLEGLQGWWTTRTSGSPAQGGTLAFRFGEHGGCDMQVLQADPGKVLWECVSGPDEWLGTRIEFDIQVREQHTQLLFRHAGWQLETPFFHHCSMKWATFLLSLRDYVESGQGRPHPNDLKIEAAAM